MADCPALALRRVGALFAFALLALVCGAPGAARAETVVSLTFDDNIASQYEVARPALKAHGMLGTFYVNSGTVGSNPYYMTWQQLAQIHSDGNEIAGHTIHHAYLDPHDGVHEPPSVDKVRSEICDDAAALRSQGYDVLDFAYPYGAGYARAAVTDALAECGYVSARTFGQLREKFDCTSDTCPYAETIPPEQAYRVRTPGYKLSAYDLEDDLEEWVTQAQSHGGGWVPIVFHEIDNSGDPSTVTPDDFRSFLDWLQTSGAVVKTVRSVMGYPDFPPVTEQPQPVHTFFAGPAPDRVTAFASLKAPKRQDVDRLFVTAAMLEPGTLSAAGTVGVTNAARVFKLRPAFATATPGKRVKLRLTLSKKGLRAAKRALRAHRRVRARITITATDTAGNHRTAKRTVRLRD